MIVIEPRWPVCTYGPADVPHFTEKARTVEGYQWEEQRKFLQVMGLRPLEIPVGPDGFPNFLAVMNAENPETYWMLGCGTSRGFDHTVIMLGGGKFHDPHPSGEFYNGPLSNGRYEATFLTWTAPSAFHLSDCPRGPDGAKLRRSLLPANPRPRLGVWEVPYLDNYGVQWRTVTDLTAAGYVRHECGCWSAP